VIDWRALVAKLDAALGPGRGLRTFPPVSAEALGTLSAMFGTGSTALLDLYAATDGVQTTMRIDGAELEDIWLVWSAEEFFERNATRAEPECFDFAYAGVDGIVFRIVPSDGDSVRVYWPMERREEKRADSLQVFLEGWCSGKITI
jgi:hypothetical protein